MRDFTDTMTIDDAGSLLDLQGLTVAAEGGAADLGGTSDISTTACF
jgi:hypothetical protein